MKSRMRRSNPLSKMESTLLVSIRSRPNVKCVACCSTNFTDYKPPLAKSKGKGYKYTSCDDIGRVWGSITSFIAHASLIKALRASPRYVYRPNPKGQCRRIGCASIAFVYRQFFNMTAQGDVIARLLAQVQQAGTLYPHGSPSAKGYLLDTIKVLQQEIEGPAEYLSRIRPSIPYHTNNCTLRTYVSLILP